MVQIQFMKQNAYHYDIVARAISYIDASRDRNLSLEEIAAKAGLSAAHFQRVFSEWAGVSPKRFQQYLTIDLAKTLLQESESLLETSFRLGLSSPSRLHDLFLTWEAMTPGDYARRGEGLLIEYTWQETSFGPTLVMATERGICGMAFGETLGEKHIEEDMMMRWPKARFVETKKLLFEGLGAKTHLHLIGAPFQIKVWEALLEVPTGHVTTYADIASRIGSAKAHRAVGTAVGRNPIGWLIPCHRVIRKSGGLGGYHWGLPRKRALLAWEAIRNNGAPTDGLAQETL